MKKICRILLAALVLASCVGQKEDEDLSGGGNGTTAEGRPGVVLDFTATWCVNCPRMEAAIQEASAERPIIPIAVHFQDEYACEDGKALITHYGVQAYPTAVMNLDPATLITATAKELIVAKLDASCSQAAVCGIEVSASSIIVTAEETATYSLFLAQVDGENRLLKLFTGVEGESLGEMAAGSSVSYDLPAITEGQLVIVVLEGGKVNAASIFTNFAA